jgi:hypothetical protein
MSLPKSAEAVEAPASVAGAGTTEAIVVDEGSLPPRPVAADAEDVETHMPDEPTAPVQEPAAPETMTRAASPEIQEAEGMGASLS